MQKRFLEKGFYEIRLLIAPKRTQMLSTDSRYRSQK